MTVLTVSRTWCLRLHSVFWQRTDIRKNILPYNLIEVSCVAFHCLMLDTDTQTEKGHLYTQHMNILLLLAELAAICGTTCYSVLSCHKLQYLWINFHFAPLLFALLKLLYWAVDRLILYPFKNTNPLAFQEIEPIQNVVVKLFLGIGCGKLSDLHITHTRLWCSIAIFDRHSAEILFSIIKPDEGMLRFMMLKRNTNIMSDWYGYNDCGTASVSFLD